MLTFIFASLIFKIHYHFSNTQHHSKHTTVQILHVWLFYSKVTVCDRNEIVILNCHICAYKPRIIWGIISEILVCYCNVTVKHTISPTTTKCLVRKKAGKTRLLQVYSGHHRDIPTLHANRRLKRSLKRDISWVHMQWSNWTDEISDSLLIS